MKTLNKILAISLAAVSVTSCADLDADRQGYYVTTDEKQEVVEMNPEMAQAAVTGCFANFNIYLGVYGNHFDFGFPAIMLGLDLQALDVQGKVSGYNWHQYWERYLSPDLKSIPSNMMWSTMYNQIFTTNALIKKNDPDTNVPEFQFYLGQGYALRAYDYFQLAQSYAFNYEGHETDPCVPIITEKNQTEVELEGVARSTVQEVYDQILSDLNTAIKYIEKSKIQPQQVISTKPKRMMSLAAAYGLRARINLVMHNYNDAADDAQKAIDLFPGQPYSIDDVSRPSFNNLDDSSWMWGIAIAETDRVVTSGIVNWPSFMVSFAYGYVPNGSWKYCGYQLYSYLPESDVRKGWFLNDKYTSPNITPKEKEYLSKYIPQNGPIYGTQDSSSSLFPQTNVKFAPYRDEIGTNVNANDIPLMRIEEMYLTLAEAKGMNDVGAGKQVLESFVKTYRDPKYVCKASSTEEFQNECWMQRRAELWGEGLSFFDIKRLGKGVNRANNRTCFYFRFNLAPDDPILNYCVPQDEVNANPKISFEQAGTISSNPQPFEEDIDY